MIPYTPPLTFYYLTHTPGRSLSSCDIGMWALECRNERNPLRMECRNRSLNSWVELHAGGSCLLLSEHVYENLGNSLEPLNNFHGWIQG